MHDAETCGQHSLALIEQMLDHDVPAEHVAAILIEPVLGEGGYVAAPATFLQGLRDLATRIGALLVFDEVQTGFGRTGAWFAAQRFGVTPDVMTLAKALGGGLPLGAVVAPRAIHERWKTSTHGSTFGGNPVSCAAANATITLLKESLVANAASVGAHLLDGLREVQKKHQLIGDVRGKGLMVGVELVRDRQTKERAVEERNALVQAMFRRGVLILGAGKNAIRLAPPLVFTKSQADILLRVMDEALTEINH